MKKSKYCWGYEFSCNAAKILGWCTGIAILIFTIVLVGVYREGTIEDLQVADAIVVLGAAQWNGAPSPVFQARLDRAHDLYVQGYAPLIILTGGKGKGSLVSDADVGREYLIKRGINHEHLFFEEESHTTMQNIHYAFLIMRAHNLNSILLVSHDFHMMRARKMASDSDITAFIAPVKTRNEWSKFQYSLRETFMYFFYILFKI